MSTPPKEPSTSTSTLETANTQPQPPTEPKPKYIFEDAEEGQDLEDFDEVEYEKLRSLTEALEKLKETQKKIAQEVGGKCDCGGGLKIGKNGEQEREIVLRREKLKRIE